MAYPVTLGTLSERVLQRANLEGGSPFIKPYELTDLINGSVAEWVDEVRGTTWNGSYTRSSYSFTSVGQQRLYALPQDFLSLISVDISIAGGSPVITARAYQEEQRNAFLSFPLLGGWGLNQPIWYQVQGPNISFIPTPQGPYTIILNYTPTAPVLAASDDSIDSVNGWEEFIVLDAAIKCLIKAGENETIPVLTQRLESQRQRIRSMAPRRDQQTAERVHVIENAGIDWDS